MASNSFNNVIQQPYSNYNDENPNKKSKKGVVIFILFFILLLIVFAIFAFFYLKDKNEPSSKADFLKYLNKNNFQSVLNFDTYKILMKKMKEESFESTSDIKFNINVGETEIKDVELNLESKSNSEKNKKFLEASLNYLSNELFNLKFLTSEDSIGIISDEIIVKYIGSSYKNLGRVLADIFGANAKMLKEIDFSNGSNIVDAILKTEMFPANASDKYIEILNKNVEDSKFSEKNVALERSTGNINVKEYTMSVNETEAIDIVSQMLQTLESDEELLNSFLSPYSNLGVSIDNVKQEIDNLINTLHENEIDDSNIYTIKTYVYDEELIKMSINLADNVTIDLEYEAEKTSNSISTTILDNETDDGISIKIDKANSSVGENIKLEVSKITDSEIIGKLDIDSKLIDSDDKYEMENNVQLTSSDIFNFDVDMTSSINFKEVEVEDLTEENCLFIDKLDKENFDAVINDIKNQVNNVFSEKMSKLLLIDSNINPTIIEQEKPEDNNSEQAKEEAKNKLINAIGDAMYSAEQNGEEYTLKDLENLYIDGSEVSVNVGNNMAVIIVDGFTFNIDSEFILSE